MLSNMIKYHFGFLQMNDYLKLLLFLILYFSEGSVVKASSESYGVDKDSVLLEDESKKGDRGVLLNAKDATEPRQVEIGLPMIYTVVAANGLPVVHYFFPNTTSNHWRNEMLLSRTGLLDISEVAIKQGEIGYGVDSYLETGGTEFCGKLKYGGNSYGAQNFDLNLSGPISKKWFYTLSVYQNFDPGNFDLKFTNFVDRAQFYTAGLSHLFNQGKSDFSIYYKYTDVHPLTAASNLAPFIYNGDGSVEELPDFKMGRDSYLPVDGLITYRDLRTGKLQSSGLYDLVKSTTHNVSAFMNHALDHRMELSLKGSFSYSDNGGTDQLTLGIIENGTAEYLNNGGIYKGNIQRRQSQLHFSKVIDAMFTAELRKKTLSHDWAIGLNDFYTHVDYSRSTSQYYHEVKPNPKRLIYEGEEYSNLNGNAEYDYGRENKLALYFMDTWKLGRMFRMKYGGRVEYFHLNVDYIKGIRYNDMYLGDTYTDDEGHKQTVRTTNHINDGLNYALSVVPTFNIVRDFGLTGELNYILQYRHLEAYSGMTLPYYDYRPYTLGRIGLFFNHPFIDVVTAFTYASRANDYKKLTVVSEDPSEDPILVGAKNGIRTMGWVTDAKITPFSGFQLHLMFTLQSPQYKKYEFEAFDKYYDFGGKIVPEQSKILLEIDPSYRINKFNVWASFRYFSKQYANVGNSVYFDGRWETFAGMSYELNKYLTLNVNAVNLLNQYGARGAISGSELITDGSKYAGTLMAGNYIRPFSFEFGGQINF